VIKYARLCNGYGRLNRPAIMVYGGSIHSGKWKGESLNIVSAFEALGKNSITRLLRRTLRELFKTHVLEQVLAEECIQQIPCLRLSKL
jgi:dihydroxyacid dehydratase/phosphogluconate dehydratase